MSHHQAPPVHDVVLQAGTHPESPRLRGLQQVAALGLVVGPVAFVAAWAVAGAATEGYSPIDEAISRLAAVDAPQRNVMTLGFVAYGAYLLAAVPVLRRSSIGRCWPAVAVNALATWAVAALPLDRSSGIDAAHGRGRRRWATPRWRPPRPWPPGPSPGRVGARRHRVVGGRGGHRRLLALTVVVDANGLAQRVGLGIGDVWLAVVGVALAGGHLVRAERPLATPRTPSGPAACT